MERVAYWGESVSLKKHYNIMHGMRHRKESLTRCVKNVVWSENKWISKTKIEADMKPETSCNLPYVLCEQFTTTHPFNTDISFYTWHIYRHKAPLAKQPIFFYATISEKKTPLIFGLIRCSSGMEPLHVDSRCAAKHSGCIWSSIITGNAFPRNNMPGYIISIVIDGCFVTVVSSARLLC